MAKKSKRSGDVMAELVATANRVLSSGPSPWDGALREPKRWVLRVFSTRPSPLGHAGLGWVDVKKDDLAVEPSQLGFRLKRGRLVRGADGNEVLMKMDMDIYRGLSKRRMHAEET